MVTYYLMIDEEGMNKTLTFDDIDTALDCYNAELDRADLKSTEVSLYKQTVIENGIINLKIA